MKATISISQGDITDCDVSAIVNPSNTELKLASGVAKAILKKGGDEVQEYCDEALGNMSLEKLTVGMSIATRSGDLEASTIIHQIVLDSVEAKTQGKQKVSADVLWRSTVASLVTADTLLIKSLALPAVGTGYGGLTEKQCAQIMLNAVIGHLDDDDTCLEDVRFILFHDSTYKVFTEVYDEITKSKQDPVNKNEDGKSPGSG